ncbi:MarC family protein [Legionella israelensis]|uniref:UPF0056 membrane protein n=1 Tax=Legionella israelensis TaxID=454 RepID=A0A0W0V530_9GAMM|nr:MarC family protein [Legionella israelensis]KTD14950.1 Multiple antibiotic resistance (MarC)-related protein [Legionella israelensis]QBS09585.1 NAAT family transporter [Legionella israelensis]SCY23676.1 multiple antibiotic resistance protein [Legionella israelensis DSM 19235]STX60509.1 Multiple antibiotic resistance (MarC)-related protein [Legionella israelensis]
MDYSLTINFMLFSLGALIAILNPIGILPQYISFTEELSEEELKWTTKRAILTAGSFLLLVNLMGAFILQFFKITIPAFKIAGGIILFKISLDMLYVRMMRSVTSHREFEEGIAKEDVSIFPLAIPLIAGPGSITTVIMLGDEAGTMMEYIFVCFALLFCISALYLILLQARKISEHMGQIGINVMTRIMGLILAAIATQFIIDGLSDVVRHYVFLSTKLNQAIDLHSVF